MRSSTVTQTHSANLFLHQDCNSVCISCSTRMNSQHHSFPSHCSTFLVFFLRISLPWNVPPVAMGKRGKNLHGIRKLLFFIVDETPHSVVEENNSVTRVVLLCCTSANTTWEKTVKILQPVNEPEESFLHTTLGRGKWFVNKIERLLLNRLIDFYNKARTVQVFPSALTFKFLWMYEEKIGPLASFTALACGLQQVACFCVPQGADPTESVSQSDSFPPPKWDSAPAPSVHQHFGPPQVISNLSESQSWKKKKEVSSFEPTSVSQVPGQHKEMDWTALWGAWPEERKARLSLPGVGKQEGGD